MSPRTMFDKIWDAHIVRDEPGEVPVLYIDRHLTHEATSPQAFEGLRARNLPVHRPDATIAVVDHNLPTVPGRTMLDVVDGLTRFCQRKGIAKVSDLTGAVLDRGMTVDQLEALP